MERDINDHAPAGCTRLLHPFFSEQLVLMPHVVVAYFDAGGGHRAAAHAIKAVLESQSEPWTVTLLNLQEHLDALDPVRRMTGIRLQDIYNGMLNRGFTRSMRSLLPLLHATVRVCTPLAVTRLAAYWRASRPDVVISVAPNLNRALALSLGSGERYIPFVTVITDFADTPPHFWMEAESEYIVCGTRAAVDQALRMGHPREKVFATSGMILHPAFYAGTGQESQDAVRQRLSLAPHLTTVLVMFGGQGSREMLHIADGLDQCSRPIQAVYICGRNEQLLSALQRRESGISRVVVGFTTDVRSYMAASDVMIGKAGPGSISEAMHFGLPVIVSRNPRTMPQEVYNTHWVEDRGVGLVIRDFRAIEHVIDSLLASGRLDNMRAAARQIQNRAVFEIPAILQEVLSVSMAKGPVAHESTGVGTSLNLSPPPSS